jgi:hypothetical protein
MGRFPGRFGMRTAVFEAANEGASGATTPFKIPGLRETVEVKLDVQSIALILGLLLQPGSRITISGKDHLAIQLGNGGLIELPEADGIVQAFRGGQGRLLDDLNRHPDKMIGVLERSANGSANIEELGPPAADRHDVPSAIFGAAHPRPLADGHAPLAGIGEETQRFGRDDLKRGEFGSRGQVLEVGVGTGLQHLIGLGDEDRGHRNGEKLVTSDNARFAGETLPVGTGIDHLWLLGDVEYTKASLDEEDNPIPGDLSQKVTLYAPLAPAELAFQAVEDNPFSGRIFDPAAAILPVTNIQTKIDPALGTVTLGPNGLFDYTPPANFSGVVTFDFSFTDPRTGLVTAGTVELTVAAVADPAIVGGAAVGPEDTAIALPMTIDLTDLDGSELLQSVVISGIIPGATMHWDAALSGIVTNNGNGAFSFTGSAPRSVRCSPASH